MTKLKLKRLKWKVVKLRGWILYFSHTINYLKMYFNSIVEKSVPPLSIVTRHQNIIKNRWNICT